MELTSTLHALGGGVDRVGEGADDAQFGEEGHTMGPFELRGRPGQVGSNSRQGNLGGVRLEDHQIALQGPQ